MWNAVDGQLTAERRTRTMRLVGSKNTSQIEARRFRPLLGWELNGIRQRLPQGSIGVIFCLARPFFCQQIIQSIGGVDLSRTL